MGWVGHERLPIQQVPDRIVSRQELAEEMGVSVKTVDRLKKAGMPYIKFSPQTTRYRLNEALHWAEKTYTPRRSDAA